MRPRQWVKNLFVLAPVVFAQDLFVPSLVARVAVGVLSFCLLSSAVYVLNDLLDVEADRAHPIKKLRPIPSGELPQRTAWQAFAAIVVVALAGSVALGWGFTAAAVGYLVQNVAYSLKLKRVAYLDVLLIAAGFELRVLAGAFAARVGASMWMLVVTFLLALFLGFGKRRHELAQGEDAHRQRSVLKQYSRGALDVLLWTTALATTAAYAAYTVDPATTTMFHTPWLVLTTANTAFGVVRFLVLVRRDARSESPTEEILKDPPFLANLLLWGGLVVVLIYFTGHQGG